MSAYSRGGHVDGPPEYRIAYWHDDHWSLTERHNAPGSGCDRILTAEEIYQKWARRHV